MHIAVGLLTPDAGTVTIGGLGSPARVDVRRAIGIAPQSLALYDLLTAEENLRFFAEIYGLPRARVAERVDWALVLVGVLSLLIALGVGAFDVRPQSWLALLAAVVSAAVAFVGIILMLASFLRTEHAVGGIGPAVMMPEWMLAVSHISPVKWAILGFEGAIWRGFGPMEMLLPCGLLLGVGLVTFVLGSRASTPTARPPRQSPA